MLTIKRLSGVDIKPYIADIAKLRISVFREFPYLYDGNFDYEQKYLKRYLNSEQTVVVICFDNETVVGASTGMPMQDEEKMVREPFEKSGFDINDIFYFGESILLKEYRGQGIGSRFFTEREAHATKLGYNITTFCAVDRPDDHPRRPAAYTPLDAFWSKRAYKKKSSLKATFNWQDLDEDSESPKSLTFWLKNHDS